MAKANTAIVPFHDCLREADAIHADIFETDLIMGPKRVRAHGLCQRIRRLIVHLDDILTEFLQGTLYDSLARRTLSFLNAR